MAVTEVHSRIDEALGAWRQGDCFLGDDVWFLFRSNADSPLTPEAAEAAREGLDAVESQECGFMLASQTCDIVRTCSERPFVEVCPLIEVADPVLNETRRARRPAFAFVPGVEGHNLVADLDRVMTVEKSVVAAWTRSQGCRSDSEARQLAVALARKRARFAFPDDFVQLVAPFASHAQKKHGRNSPAGEALRGLREIRVHAAPSWDATQVALTFFFIPDEDAEPLLEATRIAALTRWLELLEPAGRFAPVDAMVTSLDDLTARDYVDSDPLDLDHLSHEPAT